MSKEENAKYLEEAINELNNAAQRGDMAAEKLLTAKKFADEGDFWGSSSKEWLYDLATAYYKGEGVGRDFEKAVYWYNVVYRSPTDINGIDKDAAYALGMCYLNGESVEQDFETAMRLMKTAADSDEYGGGDVTIAGNMNAMRMLGYMYRRGKGVDMDIQAAISWYKKAIAAGDNDARYNLACVYGCN